MNLIDLQLISLGVSKENLLNKKRRGDRTVAPLKGEFEFTYHLRPLHLFVAKRCAKGKLE